MDEKWFKQRQKTMRVTADQIADRVGKDRSVVSKILSGKLRMSLEWANAFAETLDVPVGTILEKAGVAEPKIAQQLTPGFAESDALPWTAPTRPDDANKAIAAAMGGARPGVDVWRVKGSGMLLGGYLPGDFILVDTHASERVRAGDVVIAQHYQPNGAAITLLRRYDPPVLVAASVDPADRRVLVVDGANVVVRGKVTGSWRSQ